MNTNWLCASDAWKIAEREILSGTCGKLCSINIFLIICEEGFEAPERVLKFWINRLCVFCGELDKKSVKKAPGVISAIGQFSSGTILRIYCDSGNHDSDEQYNFEIIGVSKSLFYRSNDGLLGYMNWDSGSMLRTKMFFKDFSLEDVENTGTVPPVRLGILSTEHPHATGNHFPALARIPNLVRTVSIVHDTDNEEWVKTLGAQMRSSKDDILRDSSIEAVLVTSKNYLHASDSIAAADAHKDILCDKPIALNADEALAIVRACRKNKIVFVTTFPLRFHPVVQQIRNCIVSGAFGKIIAFMATNHGCMYEPGAPDWVKDTSMNGGGCIIDHTVHVADLMRYFSGEEFMTVETYAVSALKGIAAEDIAVSHGMMTGGILYQIDSSWSRKGSDPCWGDVTFRILGEKGSAYFDLYNNRKVEIFTEGRIEYRYPNSLLHQHCRIFTDYYRMKRFGEKSENADEIDGLRTVELVDASYESLRRGVSIEVKRNTMYKEYV